MANVKISIIGALDMLKFKNLAKTREQHIQAAPAKEVVGDFPINMNAKALHPDFIKVVVADILEHPEAGAKSFIFSREDGAPLPYFRAGQYLSIKLRIGDSFVTRPYSISSAPKWALEGKYAVTIKTNPSGFAADWMLENLKVGDELTISAPQGDFFYEGVRDCKNVVALAGGSGITPFLSMAYAIRDGHEDFNLTIIFGSRNQESILFKKELDAICAATDKVKVVHVLSDEKGANGANGANGASGVNGANGASGANGANGVSCANGANGAYERGFITAELIKKYAEDEYSIFICGPEAMYRFVKDEVAKLGLPARLVRSEALGVTKDVAKFADYPAAAKGKTFKLTVKQGPQVYEIKASADEPVLVAIERAGIKAPSRCRSGECGWCRSRLVSGECYVPAENEGRRWADKKYGFIHPCASFPVSDLVLEVPGEYY